MFFLEGLLPLTETPSLYASVELTNGRAADLHFHRDGDDVWAILLDVTDQRDAARRMQQKAYDMTLLQEKEALLNRRLEAANQALTAANQELATARDAARDVEKVLSSAVANAEANHGLDGDELYVLAATVGAGPTLKRWRARARGRVARIKKRTCHITISLALPEEQAIPAPLPKPAPAAQPAPEPEAEAVEEAVEEEEAPKPKRAPRKKAEPADEAATEKPKPKRATPMKAEPADEAATEKPKPRRAAKPKADAADKPKPKTTRKKKEEDS